MKNKDVNAEAVSILNGLMYDVFKKILELQQEYPGTDRMSIIYALTANYKTQMRELCGRRYGKVMKEIWKQRET